MVDKIRKSDYLRIVSLKILDAISIGDKLEMYEVEPMFDDPTRISYRFVF